MYKPFEAATSSFQFWIDSAPASPLASSAASELWHSGFESSSELDAPLPREVDVSHHAQATNLPSQEFTKFRQAHAIVQCKASIKAQATSISLFENDWDGYGAPSLASKTIELMVQRLTWVCDFIPFSAPQLVPGGDGSLQAEWHQNSITLTYNIGDEGDEYIWMRDRETDEVEHNVYMIYTSDDV